MMWQDIKTAPKDGEWFLAWSEARGYIACNEPKGRSRGQWTWSSGGTWSGSTDFAAVVATHWMPLPAPPEGKR